jgi:uncharacterized membrane protein YedE/YeeE
MIDAEMIDHLFPHGVWHYFAGGLLVGAGVAFIFLFTGAVSGMSSVFSTTWSFVASRPFFRQRRFLTTRVWRLVLAAGLLLGAAVWWAWLGPAEPIVTHVQWPRLLAGGFLAGLGARMSGGCTSGHGICGLASFQLSSLLAVVTFLVTAIVVAHVMLAIGVVP